MKLLKFCILPISIATVSLTGCYANLSFEYKRTEEVYTEKRITSNNENESESSEQDLSLETETEIEESTKENLSTVKDETETEESIERDRPKIVDPEKAREYYNKAFNYYRDENYQEAEIYYSKALAIQQNYSLYYSRGQTCYKLKKYRAASEDFRKCVKFDSTNGDCYYYLAKISEDLGDLETALLHFDRAVAHAEGWNYYYIYKSRGDLYFKLEDYQSAIADYDRAIEEGYVSYNSPDIYGKLSYARSQLGDEKGAKEDYDRLISSYDTLIKQQPNNASYYYNNRGNIRLDIKDYPGAIEDYNQAIKLDPNSPVGYYNRGIVRYRLKYFQAARRDYQLALNKDGKYYPALVNIGLIEYENGAIQQAIIRWQQALKIDANLAEAKLALATVYYNLGRKNEALNLAKAALEQDKRFSYREYLVKNIWGDILIKDTEKMLSELD